MPKQATQFSVTLLVAKRIRNGIFNYLAHVKRPRKEMISKLARREALLGYLFISPWLLGLLIFQLGPILFSLYLSFNDYSIISAASYVGLENYVTAFSNDRLFWKCVWNTGYYALTFVPLSIIGSFLCALLLDQSIRGRAVFRTLFFLPSITPIVAMTLLWMWILNPDFGLLNYGLSQLGIPGPGWFSSTKWSKPAIIVIGLWTSVGGARMIIFLAGLQGIPQDLYESAMIDGAGAWSQLRHITVPMLSPVVFLNIILATIEAFRVFTSAYIATGGGPAYSTYFYVLHLFNVGFKYLRMGYASALAWIFLLVVFALTYLQFRLSGRWVFYAGER